MTEPPQNRKVSFQGRMNRRIVGHLTHPYENGEYFAIFLHSFDCAEGNTPAREIAAELGRVNISTLCINLDTLSDDSTSRKPLMLSDYIQDLVMAYQYVDRNYGTKILLIGHSAVGVSILAASQHMENVAAITTIAAPADPAYISHLFGIADTKSGDPDKARLDLKRAQKLALSHQLSYLNKPYLIVHSTVDEVVDVENAFDLFNAAHEPKRLLLIDSLDHMISRQDAAQEIGAGIASWALPFLKE